MSEGPEAISDEAHLVDIVDQLAAVLPGFAARIRTGEVTPELYIRYGDMLRAAAIMCWALAPDFGRLADELFGDDERSTEDHERGRD